MDLIEGQWQIGSVKFGKGTKIPIMSVEPIGYEVSAGDRPLPMSDQIRFTKDYIQPGVMQFQMAVLDNHILEDMLDAPVDLEALGIVPGHKLLEELKNEWFGDEARLQWGKVKPLTYRAAGYNRMVYGRPRNFASAPLKHRPGWYGITASYQLADASSYEEQFEQITINPTANGVNGGSLTRDQEALSPTWLKAAIIGPIINPTVKLGPFTVPINYVIPAGQAVELNSFPWERRAVTSTNLNIGSKLPSDTYLEDLRIPAKATWPVALHGGSTTSATKLLVQWQEAYRAI
ncbi:minor tail protein [Gordonia phage Terapin]|uniref:Minor tail protein n=4 Tax=Terapinvirus terapin TaxID=2734283 RepID=A0A345MB63_9CAUD|nr:minor tail protein [Gordonia phage Terapin]AVP43300.1 minor tail protein [Gordonia phage Djokovic]AXH67734.1 minor tail protein [Gordonia phage Beyoncage]QOC56593.1 minor tail protein [Gordonia phage BiteSize]QYW00826.1 minor tail protein [Gordonia phage Madi]AOE44835.1 minor tail protein [Gordonia phage Terapin]